MRQALASFAIFALAAPAFQGTAEPIGPELRQRMTGVSWHRGCPVGLDQLRLLRVTHWGFDGEVRRGRLVVHRDSAQPMLRMMRKLFRLRFPIRRMRLVDAYGADDHRSMDADNTSAFNCRFVAGTSRWSEHAYGQGDRRQPNREPLRHRQRLCLPAGGRALRRSLAAGEGPHPPPWPGGRRLREERLGVGRQLVLAEGLPALLGQRQLTPRAAAP